MLEDGKLAFEGIVISTKAKKTTGSSRRTKPSLRGRSTRAAASKKTLNHGAGSTRQLKSLVSHLEERIRELDEALATRTHRTNYELLIQRIRRVVDGVLPVQSSLIVISKGDNQLLNLNGRQAMHFPVTEWGSYAGSYPEDGAQAISHLEELRKKGADYLLIPRTAFWWLNYYEELKSHLDLHYRIVVYVEDTCLIYSLTNTASKDGQEKRTSGKIEPGNNGKRTRSEKRKRTSSSKVLGNSFAPGLLKIHGSDEMKFYMALDGSKVTRAAGAKNGSSLHSASTPLAHHESRVSVIMTTYNSAKFLASSLESILRQTHSNLELIVVDDASTDNTFEILKMFADRDRRVLPLKVFKNRGTYWCKNFAITKATGRFITFQDSDDLSDPKRIGLQLDELSKHPGTVMCTCNYSRVTSKGEVVLNRGKRERKAIMAPLIEKEPVIRRVGYFDSIRTSGDDEFTRRIEIVFGKSRIAHIDTALYFAKVRQGSLTNAIGIQSDIRRRRSSNSDRSFLSAPRRAYVRQFQNWHQRLVTTSEQPSMPFPLLKRRFAAPPILLPAPANAEDYVTASLASVPSRQELLRKTVSSILPQVDFLNVYLNGYSSTPPFLADKRIHVLHSREYGDLKDNGKFFFLDSIAWGYHFTIDDDIVYPDDYVQKMILKIEHYDRQAIVGCHGVILADPLVRYMEGREVIHFKKAMKHDRFVNILGTGTTAYHVSTITLSLSDFRLPGMADLWLGVAAKRQQIPMIAIERPNRWLIPLEEASHSSLYYKTQRDDSVQTRIAKREASWRLGDLYPSYRVLSDLLGRFTGDELYFGAVDSRCLSSLPVTTSRVQVA